jgi:lipoate-protein ligase A
MIDGSFPPYSYDDDLIDAARRDGQIRVRVYRLTDTVVVLGSGSRPQVELHLDACRADGVPVLKRRGGGCAVVLDPGNVIVSVVATDLPFGRHRQHFDVLTSWLIDGLDRIGIRGLVQAGICDLVLDDRKVGGACLHRRRDLLYYSASLLVDPDLNRITRYLKHPPREPDYRRGRPHAAFLGTLCAAPDAQSLSITGDGLDAEQIATRLRRVLQPPHLAPLLPASSAASSMDCAGAAPLGAA